MGRYINYELAARRIREIPDEVVRRAVQAAHNQTYFTKDDFEGDFDLAHLVEVMKILFRDPKAMDLLLEGKLGPDPLSQ